MEGALGDEAVLADEVTVIGGKDHQGIGGEPSLIESVKDAPYMVIHEADHAVVAGDIPPEFPFVVQVTVATVSGVWPVPVSEVWLPLLSFGKVGRVAIVLSGRQPARNQLGRLVHRDPWLRHQVDRVRILEAGPDEEGLPSPSGIAIDELDSLIGRPFRVVETLGKLPSVSPPPRIPGGEEVVTPVGQTLLLEPDGVVLARMRLVGVIAR